MRFLTWFTSSFITRNGENAIHENISYSIRPVWNWLVKTALLLKLTTKRHIQAPHHDENTHASYTQYSVTSQNAYLQLNKTIEPTQAYFSVAVTNRVISRKAANATETKELRRLKRNETNVHVHSTDRNSRSLSLKWAGTERVTSALNLTHSHAINHTSPTTRPTCASCGRYSLLSHFVYWIVLSAGLASLTIQQPQLLSCK